VNYQSENRSKKEDSGITQMKIVTNGQIM